MYQAISPGERLMLRERRPSLKYSRFYYWFVVLAGIAGGYCLRDRRRRG
jgi:hypothetical protein